MHKTSFMKRTARIVSWACGSFFTIFSVLYLYRMQPDSLATTQYVLSMGQTVYSPFWGTTIITFMLLLFPFLLRRVLVLPVRFHALYYFPSCVLLGLLTAMVPDVAGGVGWSAGFVSLTVYIILFLLLTWTVLHFPDRQTEKQDVFADLWPNFLLLSLSFLVTGHLGNTNDVYHYRLKMEKAVVENDDSCTLAIGYRSLEADRSMTAMRMFSLSRNGQLGDKLFDYPQYYGSEGLLPDVADSIHVHNWPKQLFRYLGGKPGKGAERATRFFELLSEMPSATPAVNDYLLCSYLLDKNLNAFVSVLPRIYAIDDRLPLHYKEALVLYDRMHTTPAVVYKDAAIETNLNDFLRFAAQFKDKTERSNQCHRMYGNTYWWYYYFQK